MLGAAVVIVGDMIPERLAQAKSFGCEVIDLRKDATLAEQIEQIVGEPVVDCAVDCVGFEAHGHGQGRRRGTSGHRAELPPGSRSARVVRSVSPVCTSPAIRVASTRTRRSARSSIRIGLGWAKSCSFHTGQCPVLRYNRQLMMAILHDKVHPAKAVNATLISLDQAPQGYKDFDKGAAKKFVIDPHKSVKA